MTPRSFFALLIKILGLYLVLSSINVVPQFISTLFMFRDPDGGDNFYAIVLTFFMIFLVLGLFLIILWLCLFKTDWIINKLSLDKHFTEEKFDLNIHRSTILSIAIIVIGGLTFIDALPALCQSVYSYIAEKQMFGNPTIGWIIFYFIKTFIGYLLMTNTQLFVNFIERQRQKSKV